MSTHQLETLIRNPKAIPEVFQELFQNPKEFIREIDCDAEYMDSTMVIAGVAAVSLLITWIFSFSIAVIMMLPFAIFFSIVFIAVAAGVIHALRGFSEAEGDFKQYYAALAWLSLLTLPLTLISAFGFQTLTSIAMIAFSAWAFIERFKANRLRVQIGAGFVILILASSFFSAPKAPKAGQQYAAAMAAIEQQQQQQADYSSHAAGRRPQQQDCDSRVHEARGAASVAGRRIEMIRSMSQYEAGLTEWVKRSGGEEAVRQYAQRNPTKARDYIKTLNDRECARKILAAIGG